MPRRYLVVRPDRTAKDFFLDELAHNRLREGWGWLPEQDLNLIAAKVKSGVPLAKPEASAWRNRRLLPTQPDGVQPDDIIIVPNLPEQGKWVLARVTGGYRYEISIHGDYGHIVEVEPIRDRSGQIAVVEADNADVHASLRATMRARGRLWSIDACGAHVEKLLAVISSGRDTSTTQPSAEKVSQVLAAAHRAAAEAIEGCYHAAELEHLVHPLLERIYNGRVEHWGGPSEAGADLIVYVEDALGLEYTIGVQVKCYQGVIENFGALSQIQEAKAKHRIDAGVVITTAREVGPAFETRRKQLERELGIDIRVITRDELVDLVLQYLRPATVDG